MASTSAAVGCIRGRPARRKFQLSEFYAPAAGACVATKISWYGYDLFDSEAFTKWTVALLFREFEDSWHATLD